MIHHWIMKPDERQQPGKKKWEENKTKNWFHFQSINNRVFQIHFFYLWDLKIDFFWSRIRNCSMNSTFELKIQEIISLQRQKALRCESSFLVIDLICYCCGIDNESFCENHFATFYVPSSLLCPFTQEFKNQQRTAEKMFPVDDSMEVERSERRNSFPTDDGASKQHCSQSDELERNADEHKFSFYRTAVMFTRRKPHPYEVVLDIDAKVDFRIFMGLLCLPFYCCRRNLRSQDVLFRGSHQKSIFFTTNFHNGTEKCFFGDQTSWPHSERFLATCVRRQREQT